MITQSFSLPESVASVCARLSSWVSWSASSHPSHLQTEQQQQEQLLFSPLIMLSGDNGHVL